jgi:hypothetical protein
MTRVLLAVLLSSACVKPCEPWIGWELSALGDAPGERWEACSTSMLRWRVIPGGTASRWLDVLESMPIGGGWRLHHRAVLVRPGSPAVRVDAREVGSDLLITLTVDGSVDVQALLRDLEHGR